MLMRLMDKLVVEGRLEKKEFGKSAAAVYWASQDQYGDVSNGAQTRVAKRISYGRGSTRYPSSMSVTGFHP